MLLLITECNLFLEWTLIYYDRAFALAAPEDVALNPYDSHIQVKNMLLFIFAVLSFLFSLTFSPEGKHSVSLIQCSSNFPIILSFTILSQGRCTYIVSISRSPFTFQPITTWFLLLQYIKILQDQQMVSKLLFSVVSLDLQHIQNLDSTGSVSSKLMALQTSFLLLPTPITEN